MVPTFEDVGTISDVTIEDMCDIGRYAINSFNRIVGWFVRYIVGYRRYGDLLSISDSSLVRWFDSFGYSMIARFARSIR